MYKLGLPWWLSQERIHLQCRRPGFNPWVRNIPWRRKWLPAQVVFPRESHGQKSLLGYSSQGCKVLNMTEWLSMHTRIYKLPTRESLQIYRHIQIESQRMKKAISWKKKKKAGVAILHNKIDFETKTLTRNKEGHYIKVKGWIQ